MAAVVGVNTTKVDAGTKQDNWIDQGLIKSGLKVMTDVYEAAALAIGSTIKVANLPAGARVHRVDLAFDALGAATVDVGDSADANRYLGGVDVSAAGFEGGCLVDGAQYEIGTVAGDDEILITTAGAAITGTIKATIYYTN
jgi:hypothetical protein